MEDKSVQELIESLRTLRVQEERIIERIEIATERERTSAARRAAPTESQDHDNQPINVGDRVYITNKVRKPATWGLTRETWSAYKERHAVVTRVESNKVYVRTDNGVDTWRAPGNLRRIRN